jgi:predicted porin
MYEPTDYLNTAGNAPARGAKPGQVISTYGYTDSNRVDNNIYYSGTFGPVTAHLSYGLGGVPGNNTSGSHKAVGLTYSDGGFQLGAAFNRTVSNANLGTTDPTNVPVAYANPNATTSNMDTVTVGAAYTWGPVKGMLGYARNKNPMFDNGTNQYTYFGGLVYSVTPMLDLTAAYYRDKYNANNVVGKKDGKADTVVVIADYKLSKRTDVYASYDYTRTGLGDGLQQIYMPSASAFNPTAADSNSRSGFSVGVRHKF